MSQAIEIAPSLLSADFARLGEEITALEYGGANLMHLDIMDGHFVPNLTFGPCVVKAIRTCTKLVFDVHLMISPIDTFLDAFAQAGADILTIHPEAGPHVLRSLQYIKALGKKAGIALNPGTDVSVLNNIMDEVDQILVMSVNPGFGGQSFISSQLKKIEKIRQMIDISGRAIVLEVDGGITSSTAPQVIAAGATRLVAGTAIFSGGPSHYKKNMDALRN